MQISSKFVEFYDLSDTEKLILIDRWLNELFEDENASFEIFEILCSILSNCLTTQVGNDYNSFLSNDLLDLIVRKLQN